MFIPGLENMLTLPYLSLFKTSCNKKDEGNKNQGARKLLVISVTLDVQ